MIKIIISLFVMMGFIPSMYAYNGVNYEPSAKDEKLIELVVEKITKKSEDDSEFQEKVQLIFFNFVNRYSPRDREYYIIHSIIQKATNVWERMEIEDYDPLNTYYTRDNHYVYDGRYGNWLIGVNPNYFEAFYTYGKDNQDVYYAGEIIENMDTNSFQSIDSFYAKDDTHVYYKKTIIEHADPRSFKMIDPIWGYTKDKNNVYLWKNIIKQADPFTFAPIQSAYGMYALDKNHVYNHRNIVELADPWTFRIVEGTDIEYALDKNYIYLDGEMIPLLSPSGFKIIWGKYIRDDNHIFYGRERVESIRLNKFKILDGNGRYATDGEKAFLEGVEIPMEDIERFID